MTWESDLTERLDKMPLEEARMAIHTGRIGRLDSADHGFCISWLAAKDATEALAREARMLAATERMSAAADRSAATSERSLAEASAAAKSAARTARWAMIAAAISTIAAAVIAALIQK